MAEDERNAFDDAQGTSKIVRVVERETSDKFRQLEKTAKRWRTILGLAVFVLSAVGSAVVWGTGLAKQRTVAAHEERLGVIEEAMRQQIERNRQEDSERAAARAAHDAELRWFSDKLIEFKSELDDVARATGAPVRQRGR